MYSADKEYYDRIDYEKKIGMKKIVEKYDLTDVVRPLIGRSSHAHSVYFKEEDWKENVPDQRSFFHW